MCRLGLAMTFKYVRHGRQNPAGLLVFACRASRPRRNLELGAKEPSRQPKRTIVWQTLKLGRRVILGFMLDAPVSWHQQLLCFSHFTPISRRNYTS